jgi:hypothetical protein
MTMGALSRALSPATRKTICFWFFFFKWKARGDD